jgi:hypothetical protein
MKLVDHYKEMHKDESFYASSVLSIHKQTIRQFLEVKKCSSILDYGCGKANQYSKENIHNEYFFGIMPSLYDPAVKEFSKLPSGMFDAVISTDVLEHIEEEDLDKVIEQIYSKADKLVYLGICNSPAEAILPDGRNAHVTQQDIDWWLDKIVPHAKTFTVVYVYGQSKATAVIENNQVTLKKIR